ncbi:MAG: hypothetical protein ACK521_07995 [bacterium]
MTSLSGEAKVSELIDATVDTQTDVLRNISSDDTEPTADLQPTTDATFILDD